MSQITIVWEVGSEFKKESLDQILKNLAAQAKKPSSEHERGFWQVSGAVVKLYERKLMVQGRKTESSINLVAQIKGMNGLSLDNKNAKRLTELFPRFPNAIMCTECKNPFLSINGEIEGFDIIFKGECGHRCNLKPPLLMLNSRIFPDINVLVAKGLSRCIKLGCFVDFEIVIPDLTMDVIDTLLGPKTKKAASAEINTLRSFENEGKISIFNYNYGFRSVISKEELEDKEDDLILEIACLTNAILVTADRSLRDKALLKKRPTIYMDPEIWSNLKHIEEVRAS